MAGGGAAESRLSDVVSVIAKDMAAEVCSLYLRRAGDVLELFATEGLSPGAVHHTRLRVGEGLIGEIAAKARPLAFEDAQNDPKFAYRPETDEDRYVSLMGVPILRSGRVIGVLAVQNVARRQYNDEEIEALQTVAMVLAEVVAGGSLTNREELTPIEGIALAPMRLEGVRLNDGLGVGIAVLYQPKLAIHRIVAEDIDLEHDRLRMAVADMHGALDDMLRSSDFADGGEHRDVLEAYRMIAEDVGWLRRIGDAISTGLTAEAAVQKVNDETHARMNAVADPYLRERVHDLEDLANQLLRHLLDVKDTGPELPSDTDVILIARNLGPAQLLEHHRKRLRGVVLEEGSPNAHVSIVARALDIPVLGQVRDCVSRIENGDRIIVDAEHAQVFIRPSEDVNQLFIQSLGARNERKAGFAALRDLPACTVDGVRISLNMNAGLLADLGQLKDSGADGIGLYRTEVPFMVRSELPNVATQQRLYRKVLDYAADKQVIFRTLDVGGDKVLPHWTHDDEQNPAMGWRAIRVFFDRPAMLRQQLRALIRAAVDRNLSLMFPMIAELEELKYARRLLDKELERETQLGRTLPRQIRVGVMLEVPALVFQLERLLREIDFISVGTNDLLQFLFASDRANCQISERYDALSPTVLNLLKNVLRQCRAADVPVSLCGEIAGRPLDAMALIGIGFRDLSVSSPSIGPIKATIRSLNLESLDKYMEYLLDSPSRNLRKELRSYAQDHSVMI
jgi:phosphotransferase system enzyme I (PtsP)